MMSRWFWVTAWNTLYGSFVAGYSMSLNTPQALFERFLNESIRRHYRYQLSSDVKIPLMWSIIVCLSGIGSIAGSLSVGLVDRYGFKRAVIHVGSGSATLASFLMITARFTWSIELFAVGRIVSGFQTGAMVSFLPGFISEITPATGGYRGSFLTCIHIFLWIGVLVSQWLSSTVALGTDSRWPWIFAVGIGLNVVYVLSSSCFPDTPWYYYRSRSPGSGEKEPSQQERKSITFYSSVIDTASHQFVPEEPNLSATAVLNEVSQKSSTEERREEQWTEFLRRDKRTLFICLCIVLSGPLAGFLQLSNFTTSVMEKEISWFTTDRSQLFTIGFFVLTFIASVVAIPLIELIGRRPLLVVNTLVVALSNGLLFVGSKWLAGSSSSSGGGGEGTLPVICVFSGTFLSVIGFNLGCGPIGLFMHGELVDPLILNRVIGLGWTLNQIVGIIFVFGFYPLFNLVGEWVFFGFTMINLALFIAFYFYLPETKQQTRNGDHNMVMPKLSDDDERFFIIRQIGKPDTPLNNSHKTYGSIASSRS